MMLPLLVDKTPEGKIQTRCNLGEEGYFENEEYSLQLIPNENGLMLDYFGESGRFLSDEEIKFIINNLA